MIQLEEVIGDPPRILTMMIGLQEAKEISRTVQAVKLPRPLTHTLLLGVMESLGGTLEAAEVDGQEDDCYVAKLVIRGASGEQRVDCRPSDALALAIEAGAPIRVDATLLEIAAS